MGLLGADYKIENGRYRFSRVYDGENWNPQLHAPLTQPGVNVAEGEYLLAVNGHEVRGGDNIYSFFEETAGKSVLLRVGAEPGWQRLARSNRGSRRKRDGAAQSCLDRRQPAESRATEQGETCVHLFAGHGERRVHFFQPVFFFASWQGWSGGR